MIVALPGPTHLLFIAKPLQPCDYQLSKSIVYKIKLRDIINNLLKGDMFFNTDWQFEMFKIAKPMGMIHV